MVSDDVWVLSLSCVCDVLHAAMAGALPPQQGYMPANSATAGGQYVGGPGQPPVPAALGAHPQGSAVPSGQVMAPGQMPPHHQPGPNEASLAELISFD